MTILGQGSHLNIYGIPGIGKTHLVK